MAATPRGHIESSTSKSPTWKCPPGSARRLHPPHHQAGARPGQDPHARCRLARRAVCRTLDELHLCPPRPAGVVDELRLTLCSTLSERTSAYGFKAAPRGRSRRRPSLPLLPAKTPVGWREEIMTGVEPPPPCKVAAPSAHLQVFISTLSSSVAFTVSAITFRTYLLRICKCFTIAKQQDMTVLSV